MTHTVQDASHYLKTEPRIWLIKQYLENILNLVDLEKDGKIVEVDGFRLKNLSNWVDCSGSLYSNLGSVSGYCNADCVFCYEKGNPLPFVRDLLSLDEARTRIAYYSHEKEKGLPIPTRVFLEPFCNPHFLEILKLVRESDSDSVLRILTNGGLLTEDVIKELSCLQPILLSISLNSADPLIRNTVMREPQTHTKTALESIPLLQKHKIIFLGSVVAWPLIPPDDLVRTIEFFDRHDARAIRVLLPSYTQYFSDHHLFDTDKVWQNMVTMLRDLRQRIKTPVYCQPSFFWNEPLTPVVDGVIKRSPAAKAGLLAGDIILTINDHTVYTRVHAAKLLSDSYNECGSCHLLVSRMGNKMRIDLEETPADDECYPYKLEGIPLFGQHFGVFFIDDFKLNYIQELINLIENHSAHDVVLLSSKIMRPVVVKAIKMVEDFRNYFSTKNLTIHVPPHHFWGGNIILGDLYTVRDYAAYITALLHTLDSIPDLLVIPLSSVSKWGYDLSDQSFTEIEQQFSIPIEFLCCEPIYI